SWRYPVEAGMRCPQCGADSPAGMKFCGQCGATLAIACPSCGAGNPPEHKFCGQCGAPLDRLGLQDSAAPEADTPKPPAALIPKAESTPPGEMKQVTVLFSDI